MLANAKARSAVHVGNVDEALKALEVAEQYWANFYGKTHAAAWLEKIPRAQLLHRRGTVAQQVEGSVLATEILAQVTAKLAPAIPVLAILNQLTATR